MVVAITGAIWFLFLYFDLLGQRKIQNHYEKGAV